MKMEYHLNSNGQGYLNGNVFTIMKERTQGQVTLKKSFTGTTFCASWIKESLSIEERFKQLAEHNNFGFLYNIQTLRSMTADNMKKHCMDLELLLQDGDSTDINRMDLFHEIRIR
jgi:hypothetical protein